MKSRLASSALMAYNQKTEIYRLVPLRPERVETGHIKQDKKGTQTHV
jgi:hypothetical protein